MSIFMYSCKEKFKNRSDQIRKHLLVVPKTGMDPKRKIHYQNRIHSLLMYTSTNQDQHYETQLL